MRSDVTSQESQEIISNPLCQCEQANEMSLSSPDFCLMYSAPDGKDRVFDSSELQQTIPLTNDELLPFKKTNEVTYRAYMEVIQTFVLKNLSEIQKLVSGKSGRSDKISSIDLVAEKRGADYFPASVRVHVKNEEHWFVANVALTERGLSRIAKDFFLLKELGPIDESSFLPEVFFMSQAHDSESSGIEIPNSIFLAEWFRGYHEFHVSGPKSASTDVFTLWDTDNGYEKFKLPVALLLIEKVSYILSCFFDFENFREIYPWHLAAGDFIARLRPEPDVKLITVRQYQSRIAFSEDSDKSVNQALIFFFANLSVRSRLDRIDGTGELVWLSRQFVKPVMNGFLKALATKKLKEDTGDSFVNEFIETMRRLTVQEWAGIFAATLESYNQKASDFTIVESNLVDHIFDVYQNCQGLSTDN